MCAECGEIACWANWRLSEMLLTRKGDEQRALSKAWSGVSVECVQHLGAESQQARLFYDTGGI